MLLVVVVVVFLCLFLSFLFFALLLLSLSLLAVLSFFVFLLLFLDRSCFDIFLDFFFCKDGLVLSGDSCSFSGERSAAAADLIGIVFFFNLLNLLLLPAVLLEAIEVDDIDLSSDDGLEDFKAFKDLNVGFLDLFDMLCLKCLYV